ncbi:MAG: orotidine-5'-phosphate decarboxylase, partial [Oscillospiraceae bacterium]
MDKLIEKIKELNNPTVVGLDPKPEYIPEYIKRKAFKEYGKNLKGLAKAVVKYNKDIIDEIYDIVPAIKPQLAYYELLSYYGMKAYYETIEYAQSKGMYVIADGKRGDIGTTMEAYAAAHLGQLQLEGETFTPFGAD